MQLTAPAPAAFNLVAALTPDEFAALNGTCDEASCARAESHYSLCECTGCNGVGHGHLHRAELRATLDRAARRTDYVAPGFTRAMVDALDDEEPF